MTQRQKTLPITAVLAVLDARLAFLPEGHLGDLPERLRRLIVEHSDPPDGTIPYNRLVRLIGTVDSTRMHGDSTRTFGFLRDWARKNAR